MTEAESRGAIAAEARSWIGTRYHSMGRLKAKRDASGKIVDRGGVDCAQILSCVYHAVGLVPERPVEYYPPDWHHHQDVERYLSAVLDHAHEVERPGIGDVVLYKWGKAFAHGGIIVDPGWPMIVHAAAPARAVILDTGDQGKLGDLPRRFFSLW